MFLDDDVGSIDLSLSKIADDTLDNFIREAFKTTKERKAFIWGVYPVFNPYFRKSRKYITECLNFITGVFFGIINRLNNNKIKVIRAPNQTPQKDDVERSILYFIEDGCVIRFKRIGVETKYFANPGGMGRLQERLIPMQEAAELLKQRYPKYGDIFTRKTTGMAEFRLKRIPPGVSCRSGDLE